MKNFVSLEMTEEANGELNVEEGSTILIHMKAGNTHNHNRGLERRQQVVAVWSKNGVLVPSLENHYEYSNKSLNGIISISLRIPFARVEDSGVWIVELWDRNNVASPPDVRSCLLNIMERTMNSNSNSNSNTNPATNRKTVTTTTKTTTTTTTSNCTSNGKREFENEENEKIEVVGRLGSEITLDITGQDCVVDRGVTWELPSKMVVQGKGKFVVPSVSYRDSGKYTASYLVEQEGQPTVKKVYVFFLNVEGPPDALSGLIVKDKGDKVEMSWNGCSFDGGATVDHYLVSYLGKETQTQRLFFSVDKNGNKSQEIYTFKVAAVNRHGIGQWTSVEFSNRIEIQGEGFESYVKMEELGKGRFGTVFRVVKGDKEYAGKFIKCIRAVDKEKAKLEIEILSMVKGHEKLVQIISAFQLSREIVILTELLRGGELFERIVADDFNLTENKCREFVREILQGISFIHQKSIIHLDIKPENILITPSGLKIIDFGLSQVYDPDKKQCVLFGTPEMCSPEIINYEPIGFYCDIWSIGVLTYILVSGLSPFLGNNDNETFSNVTRGEFDFEDDAFDEISQECLGFIRGCLAMPHTDRLSSSDCLNHSWLQQNTDAEIRKDKLKGFVLRRKWQKIGNSIRAVGRLKSRCSTSSGHETE